ncbi:P-loop containing nucleoside triphosphate hydrolase protein [Lyophyllum atratum]|nr:P-loop containing nucleoside triphosphate hydrolase protein [Lyophyllum atratum]
MIASGPMLRSTTSQLCSKADHTARSLFHTSTAVSATSFKFRNEDASRTRLTKTMDMKPGSRSANLEVAPRSRSPRNGLYGEKQPGSSTHRVTENFPRDSRRPPARVSGPTSTRRPDSNRSFARESLPHSDSEYMTTVAREERNPSFRRRSRQDNPVGERSGKWRSEREFQGMTHREPTGSRGHKENMWERRGQLDQENSRQNDRPSQPRQSDTRSTPKFRNSLPVVSEFSESRTTTARVDSNELAMEFTSPPLMPGLLSCLTDVLGPGATPTPIQALSLKWLLNDAGAAKTGSGWKEFLLASETGSGKSIAYLLPLLQNLKQSELNAASSPHLPPASSSQAGPKRALNPRALILAPTHELSRQLSGFAKSLLHEVKLRVLCASRANMKSTKERDATARQMVSQFGSGDKSGEFEVRDRSSFPVDVVVGTPMKLLEMVKGRGWDRKEMNEEELVEESESELKPRRGRDKMIGFGKWRSQPEMGLANVEWVIVDEADVLFGMSESLHPWSCLTYLPDPDFQETTRQLLADISSARGHPVPLSPSPPPSSNATAAAASSAAPTPFEYPFNFILTSATIPSALATYLDTHHPKLMRLASPHLHHLPKTLQTEYVNWTGGNKLADIERRIRRVWAEDASMFGVKGSGDGKGGLSKVLIFCNRSSKVDELGAYLEERGIKNIALSSTSDQRKRGSNHHLDGFLRVRETGAKDMEDGADIVSAEVVSPASDSSINSDPKSSPHVMITTSLLSRGLDFSPSIRHVFIVDEPRNMIDFLHRAGRAGRAGEKGKVVVFGKMKGRGSASAKDVRKRVGSLVAH